MMNKERTGMAGRLKYFGVLPLLMIALVLFSFRQQAPQPPDFPAGETSINQAPVPVLYISADKRYFMNGSEVPFDQLGDVFKSVTQHKRDWTIACVMHDNTLVEDFVKVSDVGTPLHIGITWHVGPEYSDYIADMEKMIRQLDAQKLDPLGELAPLTTVLAPLAPLDTKLDPLDMDSPIFPGCADLSIDKQQQCSTEKLYAYMGKHLVYPESLKRDKIEGKVMVKFIVGANGLVKDASIIRTLHPDADAAVLKLINDMNSIAGKWQPMIKEGKAIDAEMILPVSFVLDEKPTDKPFAFVEEMPRPDGCEHITDPTERRTCSHGRMYKFLAENLVYPKEDRDNKLEGACIVQFVVKADGSLRDINVVRFPSKSMKLEAERVFQLMSTDLKWIRGRHEGKEVDVMFTVPVKFVLEKSDMAKGTDQKAGVTIVTDDPSKSVAIIPNPATNTITVKLFDGAHTVVINDANAKQVLHQRVDHRQLEASISVANLVPGNYYVQLISNEESRSGSFIKQ